VKPGGIILFHDVMAKIKDFGAWKYFEELETQYDDVFKFNHGFGLGVMRKPGGDRSDEPLLDLLFSKDEETEKQLRQFYVHAGLFLESRRQAGFWRQSRGGGKKGGQGKDKLAHDGSADGADKEPSPQSN